MSFVVRAAGLCDLDALYKMAKSTGGGFTNLPASRPALRRKLEKAVASFAREGDAFGDDQFLFVLENTVTQKVVGTCQVFSCIGSAWPFYSYRIGMLTLHSEPMKRTFRAQTLTLCNDLDGMTEVGGLLVDPGDRSSGLGKLLAKARYLFIKMHRPRFASRTIAELRGAHDGVGGSPFWDGVAGRFFNMSFREADEFNAIHGTQFIADLMPKHTIYTAMLSESAVAVMGVPHESGTAAMRMLQEEGFEFDHYIDIFDGGPTMMAATDRIRTIAGSIHSEIVGLEEIEGDSHIIASGSLGRFRASVGGLTLAAGGVIIDRRLAEDLQVGLGDTVLHTRG